MNPATAAAPARAASTRPAPTRPASTAAAIIEQATGDRIGLRCAGWTSP